MLVTQPQGHIVKKIFRTEAGEYILATFVVVESVGRLKARLISTEKISADTFTVSDPEALPILQVNTVGEYSYISNCRVTLSPYQDFSFFVSQPTRAPSGSF